MATAPAETWRRGTAPISLEHRRRGVARLEPDGSDRGASPTPRRAHHRPILVPNSALASDQSRQITAVTTADLLEHSRAFDGTEPALTRAGAGRVLSADRDSRPRSGMPLALLCTPLLALGLSACASTLASSFKGEPHAAAQTISNLQSDATAGEAEKICTSCSSSAVVARLKLGARRLQAGDQKPALAGRQLRSDRQSVTPQRRHDRDRRT